MPREHVILDDEGEVVRYVDEHTSGATLMKQGQMFEREEVQTEYTSKIEAPIYEPKNIKPNLFELCDKSKSQKLIKEIHESNIPGAEKQFLIDAANRLNIFNYELIADYYAHSDKEFQSFAEKLALVIIDFDKAIELGFVQLSEDIRAQYLEYYAGQ